MIEVLALLLFVYWLQMSLYYLVAIKINDVSIIDIAWGAGPATAAFILLASNMTNLWQEKLILILVALWGFRLATHIFSRKKNTGEDWRYGQFREKWGSAFKAKSYIYIFIVQMLLSLVVTSVLVFVAVAAGKPTMSVYWLGIALWALGFYYETVGDSQLKKFISQKKHGKTKKQIMTKGLWRRTRHPNYFGEVTQWWGIYVAALAWGTQAWWVIFGPVLLTYLIFNVSGMNILEEKYTGNKEWEKYRKRTNKFFPKLI